MNLVGNNKNKWDVKYIQILPCVVGEGLHYNVFITQKFIQWKTSRALKLYVLKIPDNKIQEICLRDMNSFSWMKLIPVLIHLKF